MLCLTFKEKEPSLASLVRSAINRWPGWPLCFDGRIIVHLSELDSAVLEKGDSYFYVQETCEGPVRNPGAPTTQEEEDRLRLAVKYRTDAGIQAREINAREFHSLLTMDWPHPTSTPPAAGQRPTSDEQLASVLRHLLVSVERGIEKIDWSTVCRLWRCDHIPPPSPSSSSSSSLSSLFFSKGCYHGNQVDTKDSSVQTSLDTARGEQQLRTGKVGADAVHGTHPTRSCAVPPRDSNSSQVTGSGNSGCVDESGVLGGPLQRPTSPPLAPLASEEEFWSDSSLADTEARNFQRTRSVEPQVPLPFTSRDEEHDDGYYDNTLTQPTIISQVDQDVLHSRVALLPGSRDVNGRSVVVLQCAALKENPSINPAQLAQLFMYFHSIPKKDVIAHGFLVLIDVVGATDRVWGVIDEAFSLLEANIPNAIHSVVVWRRGTEHVDETLFPSCRVKYEVITSEEKIYKLIRRNQMLTEYGGTYGYDHQEWISFRKFLEPFVNGCRLSGRHLVSVMQELRGSRLPPSASLTHQMIEQQKRHINQTFQDEQLRHLEEEGDTILKELDAYRKATPYNSDYREALEMSEFLYRELRRAMDKLSKLANKRLQKLEECFQLKSFEEESSQVLSWLCRKGEEALAKHQALAETFSGIKEQEDEFERFYFVAMRQIERGNDLLEEAAAATMIPPPSVSKHGAAGMQEMAVALKHHLGTFTEKLEDTREKIEDTAKCYHLLDKSYEWALETMRFVSLMKMDTSTSLDGLVKIMRNLQKYLDEHPPVCEELFEEMVELAKKLKNDRLLEQCQTAQLRCLETSDLIKARQATLIKAKQQLELDSFHGESVKSTNSQPSKQLGVWAPHSASTPYRPVSSHVHLRRQSIAVPGSIGYGAPIGSYTAFPSNYYPGGAFKDNYQLEQYMQHREEQFLNQGLITDDFTNWGPVTSLSSSFIESRSGHSSSEGQKSSGSSKANILESKIAAFRAARSAGGSSIASSRGSSKHRPIKKYMRRSHTWQMCDEALQKATAEVREQNEKLLHHKKSTSSNESVTSMPESEDAINSDCCSALGHTGSESLFGPVPVNTHLLTRGSSLLDLSDSSFQESCVTENQNSKTLMLIMREMIQTERDYVKSLEYIIENYIPELLRDTIPQALRGQRNVVFGNIEKIYEFHSRYFLHELEQCENTPFSVAQCFLRYEPQFYLYALYNKNKPKSDALMSEYGNAFFRKKQLELGDKMNLASYLLKPVQRMGKYALLLKQLLKVCSERDADYQDLKAAEEMVRFQLRHGNDLLAMDALRECDVSVKEQGQLLRQDEFLVWQGRSRKSLRHVFLFEDLILLSKSRRDPENKGHDIYQYKHSIKTTDIGLTEQIGESPTKFEIWFRKRKLHDTYVLQAPNAEIKNAWVHEISKLLWKQALRNREMRLAEMLSMGIGNKPCLDIRPNEDQISDRSINVHQLNRAPPCFRNSIAVSSFDQLRNNKRPHSIISVSSSSSSSSSQSSCTFYGALNLGFEQSDSPHSRHRSFARQSQCSTESGFYTDVSMSGESPVEGEHPRFKKAERSDSLLSNSSLSSNMADAAVSLGEEQGLEEEEEVDGSSTT